MSTATATTWHGWLRSDKRSPWRMVCRADTEAQALDQLLDAVADGGPFTTKLHLVGALAYESPAAMSGHPRGRHSVPRHRSAG